MFYEQSPEQALRFGDVVWGFPLPASHVVRGTISPGHPEKYSIGVTSPSHAAIMTPCCSIGEGTMALCPLIPVDPALSKVPYLAEDFTRVNGLLMPEFSVPPEAWERMSDEYKQGRFGFPYTPSYAWHHYFVYAGHDLLPKYVFRGKQGDRETNQYMVDFRRISPLDWDKILDAKRAPTEVKVLQLTIETRKQLRDKLAHYFARIPDEDQV